MLTKRNLALGLGMTGLLSLSFLGWIRSTPATAQDPAQPPRPGRMMMGGPASIAASGDYVYVLRGNTLYQFKSADLSAVTQKNLPAPQGGPGAAGNNP
jgi:hypothetical protein